MPSVYLLLTRSGTILSRLIHLATLDEFTHVAISSDITLNNLYSFSRKYARLPLPAGFTIESAHGGYIGRHPQMKCALYELRVSDDVYARINRKIDAMLTSPEKYQYSLLGVLFCAFGHELRRRRHYFCSQFVGEILGKSGAVALPKPAGLMRPSDYPNLPELTLLYHGTVVNLLAFLYETEIQAEAPSA